MPVVVILLSMAGLYVSLYFSLISYGLMGVHSSLVPAFCRMGEETCSLVIHHPDARILRVPNSVLGVAYYSAVLALGLLAGSPVFVGVVRWASWLSVLAGGYLVYSLYFRVKAVCPLCLACHAINVLIAVVVTFLW